MRSVGRGWAGGEDRLLDLLDGAVECAEDGAVALGGVVDHAGEHGRQPGADQLGIGLEVLAHLLEDGAVAVDTDHEVLAEHQLHLPGPDFLLGRLPPDRLDHREQQFADHLQGRPFGHRAQLLDQRAPGRPNSRWTDASSSALGSRRLTQTKVSSDAVAPSPPDLSR
jgi:hypothetical protein